MACAGGEGGIHPWRAWAAKLHPWQARVAELHRGGGRRIEMQRQSCIWRAPPASCGGPASCAGERPQRRGRPARAPTGDGDAAVVLQAWSLGVSNVVVAGDN